MAEKQDGFGLIWRRFQRHRFWTEKRVFNRADTRKGAARIARKWLIDLIARSSLIESRED